MAPLQRKNLSPFSLFSGSTLAMAISMLSVIMLLVWWQQLISKNLENQYRYFASQVKDSENISTELRDLMYAVDAKLAQQIFGDAKSIHAQAKALNAIEARLKNRQKMLLYEQIFFTVLLLSGHIFFLYIYFRERLRRKQTEETVLLATHELRQPLQALSLALETVAPKAKGASLKAIQSGLKDIAKLGDLIRYLAGTFAPGGDRASVTRVSDFATFMESFIAQEFSALEQKRIVTNLPVSGELVFRLNRELLRFILRNLIENALRYTSEMVEILGDIQGRNLIFQITNQGTVIHPSDFEKIGNIFYRSTAAEIQNTTGFGLGLYLCGRIARKAKGKLLLEHDASGRTSATLFLRCR